MSVHLTWAIYIIYAMYIYASYINDGIINDGINKATVKAV